VPGKTVAQNDGIGHALYRQRRHRQSPCDVLDNSYGGWSNFEVSLGSGEVVAATTRWWRCSARRAATSSLNRRRAAGHRVQLLPPGRRRMEPAQPHLGFEPTNLVHGHFAYDLPPPRGADDVG